MSKLKDRKVPSALLAQMDLPDFRVHLVWLARPAKTVTKAESERKALRARQERPETKARVPALDLKEMMVPMEKKATMATSELLE